MQQLNRYAWEVKAYYIITEDCKYDMPKGRKLKRLARKIKRNRYKQMGNAGYLPPAAAMGQCGMAGNVPHL